MASKKLGIIILTATLGVSGLGTYLVYHFGASNKDSVTDITSTSEVEYEEAPNAILNIEDEDSTTYKFDTVFGGTDYASELNSFWDNEKLDGHEQIYEYLETVDFKSMFVNTSHGDLNISQKGIYTVSSDTTFTSEVLNAYRRIEVPVSCIGVVNNYYAVYWLKGTNKIFITNEENTRFSKDFYENQMLHIGDESVLIVDTDFCNVESDGIFDYVFVGNLDYTKGYESDSFTKTEFANSQDYITYGQNKVTSKEISYWQKSLSILGTKYLSKISPIALSDKNSLAKVTYDIADKDSQDLSKLSTIKSGSVILRGLGFLGKSDDFVAFKYNDSNFVVLDISNSKRTIQEGYSYSFTLAVQNLKVVTNDKSTIVYGVLEDE